MNRIFQIDPTLEVPIYQQLVDKIRSGVRMGTLMPGQQLPTVQEMAQSLCIARGTIKRAYDELEHLGVLEKIQGRGTFICYQPSNSSSRKEQAMAAIDNLLDSLEDMGFSSTEINIFLTLKQRERTEDRSVVKVAVVECNPENVAKLTEQLRSVQGIELHPHLLELVQAYPYKLDEDMDLVITTATHASYLESILADRQKLVRVALRLSVDTLAAVMHIRAGDRVGILGSSSRFCDLVLRTCRGYAPGADFQKPRLFGVETDMERFLSDKDVVLVPADSERYCDGTAVRKLQEFAKQHILIRCAYEMDEGSFLYLEEKLRTLREEKTK
ncbi:MAG: GntR family transcriptional regulator [Oscillospiraceae bacterium]|nr:GntR family transcriptional regulator [Oscillospiraceae bacterium]